MRKSSRNLNVILIPDYGVDRAQFSSHLIHLGIYLSCHFQHRRSSLYSCYRARIMLRSRLSTLSGVSRHLSESAYGSASRRTALCQIPTPPRPRPLPIGLARYNSTSTRPPLPDPTKDHGSSSTQDQSYGSECLRPKHYDENLADHDHRKAE